MPIDLAQVDWLYVIVLAVFALSQLSSATCCLQPSLDSCHAVGAAIRGHLCVLDLLPHRVPLLPRTITMPNSAAGTAHRRCPGASSSAKATQSSYGHNAPTQPVTDVTPPHPGALGFATVE
jgi:hypothetical protein